MALPFKILQNIGAVNFGQPESAYTAETAVTIASAGNWIVPAGYQVIAGDGAAAQLQYTATGANVTPIWRQLNNTGYCGDVYSDGVNFRVLNSATTAITIRYFSVA